MFKFYSCICIAIFAAMLLCPLSILTPAQNESVTQIEKTEKVATDNTVKVMMTGSNTVEEIDAKDYLCGSVAAEMPAYYESEALKAQAIACYTYLTMMKNQQKANPDSTLKGAHLSDDSSTHQGYLSKTELKERWGDKYDEYYKKIEDAVNSVCGKVITFEGEPIIAAYHALSPGKTESAKNVWAKDIPYLVSVTSVGDKLSPDFSETLKFTPEKFKECAEKLDIALGDDVTKWLGKADTSEVGTVSSIAIGNKNISGTQFRDAFGLKSAVFSVKYENNSFTITTYGYGHGVGMSQYGADYMARQGSKYDEILKHYYTGVEIVDG